MVLPAFPAGENPISMLSNPDIELDQADKIVLMLTRGDTAKFLEGDNLKGLLDVLSG